MTTSGPVLITGGAGFIGRYTAAELRRSGRDARALDLMNPQVHREPERAIADFGGEVLLGDVRDADAVARAMSGASAVVHLAAETGVGQSMYEVDLYESVNVTGTQIVLDAARDRGLPVVVASSRAVYGAGAWECPDHGRVFLDTCCAKAVPSPSREDDVVAPVSVYGETKADAEKLAVQHAVQGLPVVAIRPQNVIGAGQALHNPYTGVLAAFASRLRQGLPPLVYGTGLQTRDFISVADVAATIAWLLDHVETWAQAPVLNVGSGVRSTLKELAEASCVAGGRATKDLEYVEITRPGDIEHACADTTLRDSIGAPAAQVDLQTAVDSFIHFANGEAPVDPGIWDRALQELSAVEQHD